jgi:superfamily I DNA/RNA helicase
MSDTRTWSKQQVEIFNWFAHEKGHLVVRARAGTGKTTTIIEAISRAPEARILLAAFNKRIAVELQQRLSNPNADAATLHSVGYGCVRRYWEGIRVDERDNRAKSLAEEVCGSRTPDPIKRLVSKLHTKGREIAPHAVNHSELIDIAIAFDCTPDEDWAQDGFDLEYICRSAIEAMALAAEVKPAAGIDFADMLFLPVRNRWLRPRYDLIVVDEAQDMNATQLEIVAGVLAEGGRIAVVGDDRQAIYGFRGADTGCLDRLKAELRAAELGLNTTYRCGKTIVAEARKIVPDFRVADSAHDGTVTHATLDKLLAGIAVGDYLLSRTNAPLIKVALTLIRNGKRARIEGRDIGAGLKSITKKLATGRAANSLPAWLEKLTNWEAKEAAKAERAGLSGKVDHIYDQGATLRALADGVSSVREIEARIDALFDDTGGVGSFITCSSVHKAKGLEADRVWILRDTLNPTVNCECGHRHSRFSGGKCGRCGCADYRPDPAKLTEESNIAYVAITRAKRELVYVSGGV